MKNKVVISLIGVMVIASLIGNFFENRKRRALYEKPEREYLAYERSH